MRLQDVLKMSWRHFCKTSWRYLEDIFARRLEDVLARRLEDVLKRLEDIFRTSWGRLEDALKTLLEDDLKTFWKRLEDVWPRRIHWSWPRRLEDVLKTSSEDVWLRRIYSSWSRRLEDGFWRQRRKTSSRCLHQDECLVGTCCAGCLNQCTFRPIILVRRSYVSKYSYSENFGKLNRWTLTHKLLFKKL